MDHFQSGYYRVNRIPLPISSGEFPKIYGANIESNHYLLDHHLKSPPRIRWKCTEAMYNKALSNTCKGKWMPQWQLLSRALELEHQKMFFTITFEKSKKSERLNTPVWFLTVFALERWAVYLINCSICKISPSRKSRQLKTTDSLSTTKQNGAPYEP